MELIEYVLDGLKEARASTPRLAEAACKYIFDSNARTSTASKAVSPTLSC